MRVIYVDDEQPALDTFQAKAGDCLEMESLHLFSDVQEALQFSKDNRVDGREVSLNGKRAETAR